VERAAAEAAAVDRARQHQAVVVIGALADQVHAPGRGRGEDTEASEVLRERALGCRS
jgi:hypothetical protein